MNTVVRWRAGLRLATGVEGGASVGYWNYGYLMADLESCLRLWLGTLPFTDFASRHKHRKIKL